MVQVVNGYACFSCADVSKAQHSVNPRPPADPDGDAATAAGGTNGTGGPPQPGNPTGGPDPTAPNGVNQPLSSGPRGTVLNLTA
jgi:hypothetical protein